MIRSAAGHALRHVVNIFHQLEIAKLIKAQPLEFGKAGLLFKTAAGMQVINFRVMSRIIFHKTQGHIVDLFAPRLPPQERMKYRNSSGQA